MEFCRLGTIEAAGGLIAGFYLVDRGLRHRLPGFPSLDRLVVLRRVSAGSGTNGHTAVVYGVESSIEPCKLYKLLSTVFDVLIFSHPSDLQKHCAKRSIRGRCFRDPGLDARSASSSCATLVGLTLDSLDNSISGKDLGLPGPSIKSVL